VASTQVSNYRHHRRRTPADIHARRFPGQARRSADCPHRDLAPGRKGPTVARQARYGATHPLEVSSYWRSERKESTGREHDRVPMRARTTQETAGASRSTHAASKCSSHSAPDRPPPTSSTLHQERKDLQRPRRHWLRIRRLGFEHLLSVPRSTAIGSCSGAHCSKVLEDRACP
jgi:hypothetical protein